MVNLISFCTKCIRFVRCGHIIMDLMAVQYCIGNIKLNHYISLLYTLETLKPHWIKLVLYVAPAFTSLYSFCPKSSVSLEALFQLCNEYRDSSSVKVTDCVISSLSCVLTLIVFQRVLYACSHCVTCQMSAGWKSVFRSMWKHEQKLSIPHFLRLCECVLASHEGNG